MAVFAAVLLLATVTVSAQNVTYEFTKLAALGDQVPGGYLINDFEPGGINNRGDVIFGADIGHTPDPATVYGEAVYVLSAGKLTQLARPGLAAPGGGTFSFGFLARVAINDEGDGAFVFVLDPSIPCCINAGLYRYSRDKGNKVLSAVVVPGQTPYPLPLVGTFPGVGFGASLTNRGDLAFTGVVNNSGDIFVADKQDRITAVLEPSDRPPGGGEFDAAGGPWVTQGGDVVFGAHLTGEAVCLSSIYVKKAGTGTIASIAHAGDPAPRGGMLISPYSPIMNDSGDVVFEGLLAGDPCGNFETMGIYLHSKNNTIAIARPGDPMPGGGKFVTASFDLAGNLNMNNPGEVVFNAKLDTDENNDNIPDTGLYLWSHGSLRLIARTGTVIPGLGTITELKGFVTTVPPEPSYVPDSGALNNDRGQVVFSARFADKSLVLLLATPR